MTSRYTYTPLKGDGQRFRLVALSAAHRSSCQVQCNIVTYELNDHPPYEALSYCWGGLTNQKTIMCGGYALGVTENLYLALQHLRPQHGDDLLERSNQVGIMYHIYQSAQRTVVWLGHEYQKSDVIQPFFERAAASPSLPIHRFQGVRRSVFYRSSIDESSSTPFFNTLSTIISIAIKRHLEPTDYDPSDDEYEAVVQLLARPWFSRSWVVQEVCAARDVTFYFGDACIDLSDFLTGLRITLSCEFYPFNGDSPGFNLIQEAASTGTASVRRDLLDELQARRELQATDPRDKVYAFLGLLGDGTSTQTPRVRPITPSLQGIATAMSPKHVFLNDKILTWVPDWSAPDQTTSPVPEWMQVPWDYHFPAFRPAGAATTFYNPAFTKEGVLILEGYIEDTIADLTDEFPLPEASAHDKAAAGDAPFTWAGQVRIIWSATMENGLHAERWLGFEKLAFSAGSYPTGEDISEVYIAVITTGAALDDAEEMQRRLRGWRKSLRWPRMLGYLKWCGIHKVPILRSVYVLALSLARSDYDCGPSGHGFETLVAGRRLARTRKGYLALVHKRCEVGDGIALCRGARFPLLLRPKGTRWQLVGSAYVHGYMQGEKWDEEKCGFLHVL
ncbi:heterokaryon incompatibility protein-domain-containing protein [Podospora aff. communis PSN243]|uniref:Heterokaryon incompatibility protein-domain-containing protein n=1 Tax=Podospora aff. communis PSN243 TaxID=3040156 RepID=A0AAV9GQF6_9PEZI|nr:heterokaryon incompatibility protein-domain-containing protein [Podospora aff. communis PSN243]